MLSHFPKHWVPLGVLYSGGVTSVLVIICGYRFAEKTLAKLDVAGM